MLHVIDSPPSNLFFCARSCAGHFPILLPSPWPRAPARSPPSLSQNISKRLVVVRITERSVSGRLDLTVVGLVTFVYLDESPKVSSSVFHSSSVLLHMGKKLGASSFIMEGMVSIRLLLQSLVLVSLRIVPGPLRSAPQVVSGSSKHGALRPPAPLPPGPFPVCRFVSTSKALH